MGKEQDTKEKILQSFREIARDCPIDKITVKQIAEKSGVTTQTFYNHFADKYDLVTWAYKERLDRIFDLYNKGKIDWKGFLFEYIGSYRKNSRYILNAFKNTHGHDSYAVNSADYLYIKMLKELKEKRKLDVVPKEISMICLMYVCGVTNIIAKWLEDGAVLTDEQMVNILYEGLPGKLRNYYHEDDM